MGRWDEGVAVLVATLQPHFVTRDEKHGKVIDLLPMTAHLHVVRAGDAGSFGKIRGSKR